MSIPEYYGSGCYPMGPGYYGSASQPWRSGASSGPPREIGGRPIWQTAQQSLPRPSKLDKPLRAISVGPSMLRGGAEQWLAYLTRFLDPRRLQVVRAVVTVPEYVDPALVAELPIPIEIGQAEAIRRAAQECDVLLCWGLAVDELLGDCRAKLCVYVAHGDGDWTRDLLARSSRSIDHVVAVSKRVQQRVCNGYPTSVIHNGVDSSRLGRTSPRKVIREAHGFRDDDFVLGYLGRFSGEKQVDLIIRAVAQLPPNFKAMFVGWGFDREMLVNLAEKLIPGRYAFTAADSYLGDYYSAMDAFCLVSNQEGFALALLEAMMCGRPVVATAVGAVPEIIEDRVNGVVVAQDPRSIADAAQLLQRHPAWARGLAAEAKSFAEEHGHAVQMARQYEDLLESLWLERNSSAA